MPDNTPFIVAAFTLTWVVLIGYTLRLRRTRADARQRLERASAEAGGTGGTR